MVSAPGFISAIVVVGVDDECDDDDDDDDVDGDGDTTVDDDNDNNKNEDDDALVLTTGIKNKVEDDVSFREFDGEGKNFGALEL